ncbi:MULTISPECIES: LysR family transcriptional regulator [unclassified Novosphingobium]|uniref:LysR family transcriptional regulator n=1 Tax=unclassified Novosphingobium TaxID=2644732 RepID=UPI001494A33F|nr:MULTISPECIES: LysR family transcriptional regulator [unclassified Novosphingobium]MBB3356984.1 DNA-binding transcriptional LysR family regulator [Novosphingobium sp. BK256]MBB3373385.1 DNA-binding transcriptional LysR family regulator [Novosphingobium sp. BK280]MBB3377754.1 DNA-binding transcriptional LysR family regulator [Novosphingobium sp. BK258]MBB3418835.1 DNA-binding transcriptional LysR family regulator [Novosphingobium sp. BK267]MBB3450330.1 DNA-binding transcriptional LysR family 
MDWNDFRLILAINRAGSLKGAARELGNDHSTIFRWLNALEAKLEAQLFDRNGGAYTPTEAGDRMLLAAERMELEALAVDREITGRDARLSGNLRITCSESLAYRILNDLLAQFRSRHEGITVELLVDNRQLDLLRREADIAIRATRPVEGDLFGRQIAETAWALYASPRYLADHDLPVTAPFEGHRFIGWDSSAVAAAAKWLTDAVSGNQIVYRSSSLINQMMAVKAGIGMALLPCYLGDQETDIESVSLPEAALTRELWLITHRDLRNTARVRAFFDIVGQGLVDRRHLLEGSARRAAG